MTRHDEDTTTPAPAAGKGRPTPKRREVEAKRRKPVFAPTTGKEAAKLRRQEAAADRVRTRQAYLTGDESALPARDRGPVRRYARDVVDVRLTLSEWLIPVALPLYILAILFQKSNQRLAGTIAVVMLFYVFFIAVELIVLSLQLQRRLRVKFPEANTKGVRLYAVMRSTQMRFSRRPKPKVKRFQPLD